MNPVQKDTVQHGTAEHEKETKYLLTREAHNLLLEHNTLVTTVVQTNTYYDDARGTLKAHEAIFRLRTAQVYDMQTQRWDSEKHSLMIKRAPLPGELDTPIVDGAKDSVEIPQKIDDPTPYAEFVPLGYLNDALIREIRRFKVNALKRLNSVTTLRKVILLDSVTGHLDETTFPDGTVDWELEIDSPHPQDHTKAKQYLVDTGIPHEPGTKSKKQRFDEALARMAV